LPRDATWEAIEERYHELLDAHPDRGGSNDEMTTLNVARDTAKAAARAETSMNMIPLRAAMQLFERGSLVVVDREERRRRSEKLVRELVRRTATTRDHYAQAALIMSAVGGIAAILAQAARARGY